MKKNSLIRMRLVCLFAAAWLLLSCGATAWALPPEDMPEKGEEPASSTQIIIEHGDSSYEPAPVDDGTLFVGLKYGDEALEYAAFTNDGSTGFRLGSFDGDRRFVPGMETAADRLIVQPEHKWYLLYDEVFSSPDEASALAERYLGNVRGLVTELDGETRVLAGPWRNASEVEYIIRWYGLAAQPWSEDCIAVYDGAGRLLHLAIGADEIALQAVGGEKPVTGFDGSRYFGSFLLRRGENGLLTVINAVELEDYVKGVIPYEMSPSWPLEALKAQAVCARSYAVFNRGEYEEEFGFDLTDDTYSQVYRGLGGADAVTDAAVDATAGQYVRYRGELCEAYYFASDGGATEDGLHIFGEERPYLLGKTDPFEQAMDSYVMRWEKWYSGESIAWRLNQDGVGIGTVVSVEPIFSELGNVIAMRYTDENGVVLTLEGRENYRCLALSSARFRVEKMENGFLFTGIGWGHNCGMSQWGAYAMADVYGYTAEDIISFYFTGAYIG